MQLPNLDQRIDVVSRLCPLELNDFVLCMFPETVEYLIVIVHIILLDLGC